MTAADIAFAQPGNPDRLRDYQQDARTVFWALLVAILIHLFVAFLLAAFGGFFSPALPTPEKPVELTFMDLSPASNSKNSAFIETDESKKAPEPKDKTFESNANSIGASELAAAGQLPLPAQTGKDQPLVDFENQQYSLDSKGAQAQQKPASQQKAAQPAAQPEPVTAGEQFALLTQKSAAALDAAAASQAQSAYRRQKQRTNIAGNITNHGISSVNALGTPLGRYQKMVADSIGSRWYTYVEQKRDLINIGTLRLSFVVDPSGRVKDLKVTENSSNEAFASVCVQSVLEAHLPPIPEEVVNTLPPEGLEVDGLGFIIFPNR